jgi:hypothetical protein
VNEPSYLKYITLTKTLGRVNTRFPPIKKTNTEIPQAPLNAYKKDSSLHNETL